MSLSNDDDSWGDVGEESDGGASDEAEDNNSWEDEGSESDDNSKS